MRLLKMCVPSFQIASHRSGQYVEWDHLRLGSGGPSESSSGDPTGSLGERRKEGETITVSNRGAEPRPGGRAAFVLSGIYING